ncbi:uncharacterized protein LOC129911804 [Episyrphus balteatus]|uniref:uncharacterized protein LOC129911804 n=1 Tax=Episyrphus balteatus TaxID=286459 RepID=UPI002486AF4F|nr:uncharacterized protein LOC129911804 [Episyrphus balteatus]
MSNLSQKADDDDIEEEHKRKVKAELPYLFEKELTQNQNKRIYIVDEFIATERVTPIEGKFYSKFNDAHIKGITERQCFWKLTKEERNGSKLKLEFPVLESQMYGWMPKNVSKVALKRINYIQAPKLRCPMTIHGEKISSERVTERTKFAGERFNLM